MNIKNTFKILIDNFINVWKVLLYKILVFLIGAGLCAGLVLPNLISIAAQISATGFFVNITAVVKGFFDRSVDFTATVETFKISMESASAVLTDNAGRLALAYIFIGIIVLIVNTLNCMSAYVACDLTDAVMSSGAKFGFSSRFIIVFWKNVKYQLARLITEVLLYIGLTLALWLFFRALFPYLTVFSFLIAFVLGIVLIAAVQVFFSGWLPAVAAGGEKTFQGLKTSFRQGAARFQVLFSTYILLDVGLIFVNFCIIFFTCGAGVLITVPMSAVFMVIFRTVNYYHQTGRKYYCGENTIVTPEMPAAKDGDGEDD